VPLSPSPWVSLIVLAAVPILITYNSGPQWLSISPRAIGVWILLAAVAAAGLLRGPWFVPSAPISTGGIVLFSAPLLQAVIFVILYRVFHVLVHRPPVSFNAVSYRRRGDGHNYVADSIFWAITFITVFVGVLLVCFHFGVEFPSRHRIR
jgi:hypothetical protein